MAQQTLTTVENNFTQGLKTEYTGLNFPENAATDTDNCVYTLIGDVQRRLGINYENNYTMSFLSRVNRAMSTYRWTNAGGDGNTELLVVQIGAVLRFYKSSSATVNAPLSWQLINQIINLTSNQVGTFDQTVECQFADGGGNLFVYHPNIDPLWVSFNPANNAVTATSIDIKTRDFSGLPDGLDVSERPGSLSTEHLYNLINQGWTQGSSWTANSTSEQSFFTESGLMSFIVQAGITGINNGDFVSITTGGDGHWGHPPYASIPGKLIWQGTVTSYSGTNLVINVSYMNASYQTPPYQGNDDAFTRYDSWVIAPTNEGFISDWFDAIGLYPSNSDVWWRYKDTSGDYNPGTTYSNVSVNTGYAPKGHFILDEFNQDRTTISGVAGITPVKTNTRPRTGTWFQGRVWYAGVDATQFKVGDADTYSWTENIYFSQIVTNNNQFGYCYQTNDPTSETLFDLLPTDGGVITIQGCGTVYKLFPIQNGMLVFAAQGIWFITGSQGIGFTANDYTITKISSVRTQSGTSFVNVQGLPYFWNEEDIYTVTPAQQGLGLTVQPLALGTILSYYGDIPKKSKLYVRGDYNPVDYIIQWVFKSTDETDVTSRYDFDKILVYNTANKAFYPYSIAGTPKIHGINYVPANKNLSSPESSFKYVFTLNNTDFSFAEEWDDSFLDWKSYDNVGVDYDSYFVTGYKVHGKGLFKFQPQYVTMFCNNNEDSSTAYKIQGIWDYAESGNTGRYSSIQYVDNFKPNYGVIFRRHKIRGNGFVLQIKVSSIKGRQFDIIGWASYETMNAGV